MTERRGDRGFAVTPQRIDDGGPDGSWRRRRRGIGVALVLAAAATLVALAWLGPRLAQRPNFDVSFFATPTPDATPSPSPADATPLFPGQATPLPAVTRPDGPRPSGRIAVETNQLWIIDLASGETVTGPAIQPGRDAIIRTPGADSWTCVCFDDDDPAGRILRIKTFGPGGTVDDVTDLATLAPAFGGGGQTLVSTDVDLVASGRSGLVAIADRTVTPWRIRLASIDVAARTLGPLVDLGTSGPATLPSPSPGVEGAQELGLDGPHVRLSPDGRVAFVWAAAQLFDGQSDPMSDLRAWRIALGADGSIGSVSAARGLLDLPAYCSAVAFAAADRLTWLCPRPVDARGGTGPGLSWEIGALDLDGNPAGRNEIADAGQDSFLDAMFDAANGQVFVWDPVGLTISRFDAHTLVRATKTFDPLIERSSGLPPGGGELPPAWHGGDSTAATYGSRLVGTADGTRVVALGFSVQPASDSGMQASRGMFVIDRRTLALVDRWAPAANYVAVTSLPDGNVAAGGIPGVNETGTFAPWDASLTIHDGSDGRILVRFGRLGSDGLPIVISR